MTSLTYTANNREGQTWLVCPGKPDILLTDYIPDGTKVRGDEIEMKWQYKLSGMWWDEKQGEVEYMRRAHGFDTRHVATLKQKREVFSESPRIDKIEETLVELANTVLQLAKAVREALEKLDKQN